MAASVTDFSKASSTQGPDRTIIVRRISFVADAPDGAPVRREFAHPRRMVAVEVASDLAASRSTEQDHLFEVAIVSPGSDVGTLPQAMVWMARSDQLAFAPAISVELKSGATVDWRPGRAIIRSASDDTDELLDALIDFAFYEAELCALEEIVESHEPQAREDVRRAHRISRRDRAHWKRIGETIELLTQARLTFARLEPMFDKAAKTSSPIGRRLMRQLSAKADTSTRLEALTGRLEALEDLYEGANDRIADFRGWHEGKVMEITIIVLLVIEIFLMSGDMYLHSLELQQEKVAAKGVENSR